jgi:hypothetical protein
LSWLALQELPEQRELPVRVLPVLEPQPVARLAVRALPLERPEREFQPLGLKPLAQPSLVPPYQR